MNDRPIHWPMGGSVSDRIVACAGCVNEAAKWPKDPSGPAAIEGTHDHTLLENCLLHNIRDADLMVGTELTDHDGSFCVDAARADRVQVALNYVWHRLDHNVKLQLFVERFVDAGAAHGIQGWGGPADIILWDGQGDFEVIDYKGGGKPVDMETYQLVTYAIGARREFQVPPSVPTTATVIQPKVKREPQKVTYAPIEWDVKEKVLVKAMRRSLEPDAPREAGDHCKYCPGAKPGRCDEFNRRATVSVNEAFANVPAVAGNNMPMQIPQISGDMSDEQLVQILDAAPIVREWLKEAEAEGLRRAMAGVKVPGYKVTRGTSQRRLADNALEVFQSMRLKKEIYLEEKLKTAKQIIENDEVKAMSDRKRKRIEEVIVKPPGALKLVPESAPGASVVVDVAEAFANVPKPAAQIAQAVPVKPSFL